MLKNEVLNSKTSNVNIILIIVAMKHPINVLFDLFVDESSNAIQSLRGCDAMQYFELRLRLKKLCLKPDHLPRDTRA